MYLCIPKVLCIQLYDVYAYVYEPSGRSTGPQKQEGIPRCQAGWAGAACHMRPGLQRGSQPCGAQRRMLTCTYRCVCVYIYIFYSIFVFIYMLIFLFTSV